MTNISPTEYFTLTFLYSCINLNIKSWTNHVFLSKESIHNYVFLIKHIFLILIVDYPYFSIISLRTTAKSHARALAGGKQACLPTYFTDLRYLQCHWTHLLRKNGITSVHKWTWSITLWFYTFLPHFCWSVENKHMPDVVCFFGSKLLRFVTDWLASYTLNNIGSLVRTLQYNHHATPGEPLQGSPVVAWWLGSPGVAWWLY